VLTRLNTLHVSSSSSSLILLRQFNSVSRSEFDRLFN
jgi:hypothetical protein